MPTHPTKPPGEGDEGLKAPVKKTKKGKK